jgi:sterol 14alpha-demethylase
MPQIMQFIPNAVLNTTAIPVFAQILIIPIAFVVFSIVRHIIQQLAFPNQDEPPLVFSWFPLIGSTLEYGADPYKFYFKYQKKVIAQFSLLSIEFNIQ